MTSAVALDRTAFYPTGGGQPHDTGTLGGLAASPTCARQADSCGTPLTERHQRSATTVDGEVDWDRRHALMRTHTALHVLCGVIWNEWRVPVTGGNMEPLSARMDFEFDPLPEGFGPRVEQLVNAELAADRADRGVVPPACGSGARRRPHPHQDQPRSRVGARDPRRRHRRARQAGRRRHARALDRPRSAASASRRPSRRARGTSASASRWSMTEPSMADLARLEAELRVARSDVVVAFSGGADSAFLASVATRTLGAERVHCVTAVSELARGVGTNATAQRWRREWGLRWTEVETDELSHDAYVANDGDRCFWCKTSLMDALDAARRRSSSDRRAGRQRRRPRRPSSRPASGGRAGRTVPAGRRGLHQGRRARRVA